jgi:hypothetical protein
MRNYGAITWILAIIAAILALTAAFVRYLRHGEVNMSLIAASLLLLAFGFAARRSSQNRD